MTSKYILGVKVDFGFTMASAVAKIEELLLDGKSHYICTTNPEFVVDAQHNEAFRLAINNAELSLPDGTGVILANRYLDFTNSLKGHHFRGIKSFIGGIGIGVSSMVFSKASTMPELIPGRELFNTLCTLSAEKGYTIGLLGGRHRNHAGNATANDIDLAVMTSSVLKAQYPKIKIVYASSQFGPREADDVATLDDIHHAMTKANITSLDFLFVAYNHMYQETWIVRNAKKIPAKVAIGVGGTFDYVTGLQQVPPDFFLKSHLGWLFRLLKEPWRYRRILHAFPLFPYLVYREARRKLIT